MLMVSVNLKFLKMNESRLLKLGPRACCGPPAENCEVGLANRGGNGWLGKGVSVEPLGSVVRSSVEVLARHKISETAELRRGYRTWDGKRLAALVAQSAEELPTELRVKRRRAAVAQGTDSNSAR